ncbi:hypothetical protein [Mycolicibacterium sp. S3B2]|uniref:hypothetical protein n=1 Tax=Mycolicibacterium sp. S3B2 TaxID=3415120 RepID=UPI003C7BD7C1
MSNTNYASELYHYFMWSHDALAALIDVSRPKVKKMIAGEVTPNNIQETVLREVRNRQMNPKKFNHEAMLAYRLKLIRESEEES